MPIPSSKSEPRVCRLSLAECRPLGHLFGSGQGLRLCQHRSRQLLVRLGGLNGPTRSGRSGRRRGAAEQPATHLHPSNRPPELRACSRTRPPTSRASRARPRRCTPGAPWTLPSPTEPVLRARVEPTTAASGLAHPRVVGPDAAQPQHRIDSDVLARAQQNTDRSECLRGPSLGDLVVATVLFRTWKLFLGTWRPTAHRD